MNSPTSAPHFGLAIALVSFNLVPPMLPHSSQAPLSSLPVVSRPAAPQLLAGIPDVGNAGARRPTGSKGICRDTTPPLTALLPEKQPTNVGGKTVAAHPTFWFYVPYTQVDRLAGVFTLTDLNGNQVYKTALRFPQAAGVVRIQVPTTEPGLELNRQYRWSLQVNCAETPLKVHGWIERVSLDAQLAQRLKTTQQPQQQANLYWSNDIWFDALTVVAEGRQAVSVNPTLTEAWSQLMRDVNLTDLETAPMAL